MIRLGLLLAAAGSIGLAAAAYADDAPKVKKEVDKRLVGVWKVMSGEVDGKEVGERFEATPWVVTGATFTARLPFEGKGEFAYKRTEVDKRGAIDIEVLQAERTDLGIRKRVYLGIYALEGDDLKVCYALPGKERPTAFATKPGSGTVLFVLKRESGSRQDK
jgi:uncharacterized protein (TIGR03067 family)